MISPSVLVIVLGALLFTSSSGIDAQSVNNKKVERTIDLSTHLVQLNIKVQVENTGSTPLDEYVLVLDENHIPRLAFLSVSINKHKVPVVRSKETPKWTVDLKSSGNSVKPGETSPTIDIHAVFTHLLKPFPEEILQSERQLVLYNGNHYFLSPYTTKSQTLKVRLTPGTTVESYTKQKPSSQSDNVLNFGPYNDIPANSVSSLQVHYENNSPFLAVNKLERLIELSHWAGKVSVEQHVELLHTGAKLKGGFSRYEFQREPTNGISSVKSFKMRLPPTARDIYYRDDIGNISTSNLRGSSSQIIADLRPRFPLFGGWKTRYTVGYYAPASQYLSVSDSGRYILRIPFVDHLYDNQVVDDATVKIILPEGSYDIKLRPPYSVNREKDQIHYTYLDTIGRPVIVMNKQNLVDDHIQNLEVEYSFRKIFMLQEPFLIVAAVFLLCMAVIIYVRLDFTLDKDAASKASSYVSGDVSGQVKADKGDTSQKSGGKPKAKRN